jgi:hypothetical protein
VPDFMAQVVSDLPEISCLKLDRAGANAPLTKSGQGQMLELEKLKNRGFLRNRREALCSIAASTNFLYFGTTV